MLNHEPRSTWGLSVQLWLFRLRVKISFRSEAGLRCSRTRRLSPLCVAIRLLVGQPVFLALRLFSLGFISTVAADDDGISVCPMHPFVGGPPRWFARVERVDLNGFRRRGEGRGPVGGTTSTHGHLRNEPQVPAEPFALSDSGGPLRLCCC